MAIPDEILDDQPLLSRNKIIIIATILALLILGSGYAIYSYFGNSNLRQYQALTAEMSMEKMRDMPAEDRKEYFENMKNLREKMTEPQKDKADDSMRERFQTQMSEKMNKFFALPPEERKVELDKEVDRMASMMKNFGGGKGGPPGTAVSGNTANRGQSGTATSGATAPSNTSGGGNSAGIGNIAGRGQGGSSGTGGAANGNGQGGGGAGVPTNIAGGANAAGKANPSGTPTAGSPPGGGGPPWARGNPNATPDQKNRRTSDMLDKSTPEFRAQMTEYWKLVGERAKEKGVQMPNFGGGPTTPVRTK